MALAARGLVELVQLVADSLDAAADDLLLVLDGVLDALDEGGCVDLDLVISALDVGRRDAGGGREGLVVAELLV